MRKSIVYFLVIIVLIGCAGIIYFVKQGGPFGKNNTGFAINEIGNVSRIILSSGKEKVVLEKKTDNWQVNKKFTARENSVEYLLKVLSKLEVKSPVSEEKFSQDVKADSKNKIYIEIFEGLKRVNSFILFKVNSNPYSNYARKNIKSSPYVLYVPGYDGSIGTLFIPKENFWKPYVIFNYSPAMIKEVKMEYPGSRDKSFHIIKSDVNHYKLLSKNKEVTVFDTLAVERYFSYFRNISFTRWAVDFEKSDSLSSITPEFILTVTDTTNKKNIIKTYPIPEISGTKNEMLTEINSELYVKQADYKEVKIARYFDLDPVIKQKKYFLFKVK